MPLTVVKVGRDPKKQVQYRKSLNLETGVTTVTVVEYWRVVWSGPQSDPTANDGAQDPAGNKLPTTGADYNNQHIAWCNDVLPQLDPASAGKQYLVQVTYANKPPVNSTTGRWDCQISFDGIPVTETTYFDLDDYQILNSANQPFSNQPTNTYYDTAVKVSFKATVFDETTAEGIRGQLNASAVTLSIARLNYARTFPTSTLKLENFSSAPVFQSGQLAYWDVSLNLTYRPTVSAPANAKTPAGNNVTGAISTLEYDLIEDTGYAFYDSTQTPPVLTTFTAKINGQDVPTNSPCLLNGQGGDGRPAGAPSPNDAHFIAFRRCQRTDFTPLFAGIA